MIDTLNKSIREIQKDTVRKVEASGPPPQSSNFWYADYPRLDFHFINDNRGRKTG
jgi:hypothetical protein